MNALLSIGSLTRNTVTCPFHGSKFDVITGKNLTEPILTPSQEMEPMPTWQGADQRFSFEKSWF